MKWRWYYWPMSLATLPVLLAFLFVMIVFYGVADWQWRDGCLEFVAKRKNNRTRIWGKPAGQCWGTLATVFASQRTIDRRVIPVHERVHVIHGIILCFFGTIVFSLLGYFVWWPFYILGPLTFGLAYGIHFLYEWGIRKFRSAEFWNAYLRIWSERVAYRIDDEFERGERPDAWGA